MNTAALKSAAVLLLILLTSVLNADAQQPRDLPDSCKAFVQAFYDWYVPLALQDQAGRTWEVALERKPNAFSNTLRRLIKQDSEAQARASKTTGDLVGLDFDPFLNSQDPSKHFAVQRVTVKDTSCLATVHGVSDESQGERVTPELKFEHEHWFFVNFHYKFDQHPDDLLSVLKR